MAYKKKMNELLESPKSDDGLNLQRGVTNYVDYKKKKRTVNELQGKVV